MRLVTRKFCSFCIIFPWFYLMSLKCRNADYIWGISHLFQSLLIDLRREILPMGLVEILTLLRSSRHTPALQLCSPCFNILDWLREMIPFVSILYRRESQLTHIYIFVLRKKSQVQESLSLVSKLCPLEGSVMHVKSNGSSWYLQRIQTHFFSSNSLLQLFLWKSGNILSVCPIWGDLFYP